MSGPTRLPAGRTFPDLLTVEEVAERLRCTRSHVYNLAKRGELGSVKTGANRICVTTAQLAEFFERNTRAAS